MIRTVVETGSTNADLLGEAQAGAAEGRWLRAERQTGGRGRLGRNWASPSGNLYASTVIRRLDGDPPAPSLALVAGVALHETVSAWSRAADLHLKWPNDLLVGPAKLAGILLEGTSGAVVAGFGVNLASAPDLGGRQATSLAALGLGAPDPAAFLDDLAGNVARWLRVWRGHGLAAIRAAWLAAAHPVGTALAAGAGTTWIEGLFAGLDGDGNLLLDRADGRRETIIAGDVILL